MEQFSNNSNNYRTHEWSQQQQQFQQVTQNGFQLAPQQLRNANEIMVSNQTIIAPPTSNTSIANMPSQQATLTNTFNPHIPAGMQVEFQPPVTYNAIQQPTHMDNANKINGTLYSQQNSPQTISFSQQVNIQQIKCCCCNISHEMFVFADSSEVREAKT